MQRIAIVGSGGAGKSTLASELGDRLGLPVIHLDRWYWRPGWVATTDALWHQIQTRLVAGERWIADGNYSSTLDLRLGRADTVIVVGGSRVRCVARVLRRVWRAGGRDIQAAGCPERFDLAFLRWVWSYPGKGRVRLDAALARQPRPGLQVIELRRAAEIDALLGSLPAVSPPRAGPRNG